MGGAVGLISSIGKFGISTAQLSAKNAEAAETSYRNQQELDRSARFADASAVDALRKGSFLSGRAREAGTSLGRQQSMAFASNGIDSTTGTAAQTVGSTARLTELQAQTFNNNAIREAFGHKETARGFRKQRDELARGDLNRKDAFGLEMAGNVMTLIGDATKSESSGMGGMGGMGG